MLIYLILIGLIVVSLSNKVSVKGYNNKSNYFIINKLKISDHYILIKLDDVSMTSSIVLGSMVGGVLIILVIVIISIYCCKGKTEPPPVASIEVPAVLNNQVSFKMKVVNQIDITYEGSKCKLNQSESKLNQSESKLNIQNDSNLNCQIEGIINSKEKGENHQIINNQHASKDPTVKMEMRKEKITKLFEKFVKNVNDETELDNDKKEFFKSVPRTNNDAVSSFSKVSMMTAGNFHKNPQDLDKYTNDKRESPTNSFYDKKMDDILELENEEESNIQRRSDIEIKGNKYDRNGNIIKEEIIPMDFASPKKSELCAEILEQYSLEPYEDDVISDYKEKTKNFRFELYKKSTLELDKESIARMNLKKNQDK